MKISLIRTQSLETQYPIMLKVMTDEETREYYLKRLERLCLESKKLGNRKI